MYDRYGNRVQQNPLGGTLAITAPQLTVNRQTNRITTAGYAHDASGNLTNDSLHSYTYDAENRVNTVDTTAATYSYDGSGLRVKKTASGTTTTYIFSGSKVIAEYVGGSVNREYIYAGGKLLATLAGSTTTYSYPDHLSTRVETDTNGTPTRTLGHLPFGDAWYETGTASKWKFTTYERDGESALDYAMFRYNSSRLGRFATADPIAGSIQNPASFNRYAYAGSDPINMVDPLGLWIACYNHYQPYLNVETGEIYVVFEYTWCRSGPDVEGQPKGRRKHQDIFKFCLDKYGTTNAKAHLSPAEFYAAQEAAQEAGIATSAVLAIWDNESSFDDSRYWTARKAGDIGPMQVTPAGGRQLRQWGQLPANYRSDMDANLLAGARLYAGIINKFRVPESDAAMVYKGGIGDYRTNNISDKAAAYQDHFDQKQDLFDSLVKCLRGE